MIPVPGNLIKITLCHKRGLSSHIAPLIILQILNPSLHGLHHLSTLRHQKRKPLTDHIYCCEKLHLTSQLIVITLFDILQIIQIVGKLLFLVEGGSINSLKHCFIGIPSPVSA